MARYSAFLGRRVEVQYRAGDILLPASGTFVADSGRSIFLEQQFEQHGQHKHFRWEIPYQYIVRLEEKADPNQATVGTTVSSLAAVAGSEQAAAASSLPGEEASTTAQSPTGGASAILPLRNRPKTA